MSGKKILMLYGSPRRDGVTARMAATFEAAFADADIRRVYLYDVRPAPCCACGYCSTHRGCVQRDLDGVYKALEQADVVCAAVPVYHLAPPAPFKALLDRLQWYYDARFAADDPVPVKEKPFVLLSAAGREGERAPQWLVPQLTYGFSLVGANLAAHVHVGGTDGDCTDALNAALEQIKEIANNC